MKKAISALLIIAAILSVCVFGAAADSETVKIKISGTTTRSLNKKILSELNEFREDCEYPLFKMDKELTRLAYRRAAMLTVSYSKKAPCEEAAQMPKNLVIGKGDADNFIEKLVCNMSIEDEELQSLGVANLTVGKTTYWAALFSPEKYKEKQTDYSKSATKYSASCDFYVASIDGNRLGEFTDKNVRFKKGKTYNGRLSLSDGTPVKNTKNNYPIIYTSSNPDAATVDGKGKVTSKTPSAFKAKGRYTPRVGDFVLFHWYKNDGWLANHIGIVVKVKGSKIATIEGNTGTYSFTTSYVSRKVYSMYSSSIVGYIDNTQTLGKSKAKSLASLAKKQIGKKGSNYYHHTKAWKDFLGGKTKADNWCAIFCGWLVEQKGIDASKVCWSPSCTAWIRQCKAAATAQITATIAGTEKSYCYNFVAEV